LIEEHRDTSPGEVRDRERRLFDLPAYIVPTMMTSIRWRWRRIAVSLRVPSMAGSALNEGTLTIVKLGSKVASSSSDGRRNRFSAKMLAQAVSV
jgi:hypothetical protein